MRHWPFKVNPSRFAPFSDPKSSRWLFHEETIVFDLTGTILFKIDLPVWENRHEMILVVFIRQARFDFNDSFFIAYSIFQDWGMRLF
jgi:hypothetical protein